MILVCICCTSVFVFYQKEHRKPPEKRQASPKGKKGREIAKSSKAIPPKSNTSSLPKIPKKKPVAESAEEKSTSPVLRRGRSGSVRVSVDSSEGSNAKQSWSVTEQKTSESEKGATKESRRKSKAEELSKGKASEVSIVISKNRERNIRLKCTQIFWTNSAQYS